MHMHTHIQQQKEGNHSICDMDGLRWHHAKRTESDKKQQILYDFSYIWNLKMLNSESIKLIKTVEWWLPEAGSWGKLRALGQGAQVISQILEI